MGAEEALLRTCGQHRGLPRANSVSTTIYHACSHSTLALRMAGAAETGTAADPAMATAHLPLRGLLAAPLQAEVILEEPQAQAPAPVATRLRAVRILTLRAATAPLPLEQATGLLPQATELLPQATGPRQQATELPLPTATRHLPPNQRPLKQVWSHHPLTWNLAGNSSEERVSHTATGSTKP